MILSRKWDAKGNSVLSRLVARNASRAARTASARNSERFSFGTSTVMLHPKTDDFSSALRRSRNSGASERSPASVLLMASLNVSQDLFRAFVGGQHLIRAEPIFVPKGVELGDPGELQMEPV